MTEQAIPASPQDPSASGDRVVFTESAARRVYTLIAEEDNPHLNLRVSINGGGCSGFKYVFDLDEEIRPDDTVVTTPIDQGGVQQPVVLLIDPLSYQFLRGSELDFKDDWEGERFIVRNPNASTTCGCGSSFALRDDALAQSEPPEEH